MAFKESILQKSTKKELEEKAEALYIEWQKSRDRLEKSANDYGKKLIILTTVGFSLLIIFRLIKGPELIKSNNSFFTGKSRISSALQSLLLPIITTSIQRMIMADTKVEEKQKDTNVDR
jgi:hypothetical protein